MNQSMAYKADVPGHDIWSTNCQKAGDCEDYALCKARKLIAAGYTPNRLMVLVGVDQDSGVHRGPKVGPKADFGQRRCLQLPPDLRLRAGWQFMVFSEVGRERILEHNRAAFQKCNQAVSALTH
jgi:Bacterial transglutaminase-like cysteine proteinase BTLCP